MLCPTLALLNSTSVELNFSLDSGSPLLRRWRAANGHRAYLLEPTRTDPEARVLYLKSEFGRAL